MSKRRTRWDEGINLVPTDTDEELLLNKEGDLAVDGHRSRLVVQLEESTQVVVTEEQQQTLINKSLDADDNTIDNLEVDNLKNGVLNTDENLAGATNNQIPSALAAKKYTDSHAQRIDQDVSDLVELTGVPKNSKDLGEFSGHVIPDDSSIKEALQSLETSVDQNTEDISKRVIGPDSSNVRTVPVFSTTDGKTIESTRVGIDENDVVYSVYGTTLGGYIREIESINTQAGTGVILNAPDNPVIILQSPSLISVNGINAVLSAGKILTIINNTGFDVIFRNNIGTTTKIITGIDKDLKLKNNASILVKYHLGSWMVIGGTGGSSQTVTKVAGENLLAGDQVYISKGTGSDSGRLAGRIYKAIASNDDRIEVLGTVEKDALANEEADVFVGGLAEIFDGLVPGTVYYLSDVVAGRIIEVPPTTETHWIVPLGLAETNNSLVLNPTPSLNAQYIFGNERTYQILNNQSTPTILDNLLIDPLMYRGGEFSISIKRITDDVELCDVRKFRFVFNSKKNTFGQHEPYVGEDTGVEIQISPSGQFTYTSSELMGANYEGDMKLYIDKLFSR